jgi:hypothetical protein
MTLDQTAALFNGFAAMISVAVIHFSSHKLSFFSSTQLLQTQLNSLKAVTRNLINGLPRFI